MQKRQGQPVGAVATLHQNSYTLTQINFISCIGRQMKPYIQEEKG